MRGGTAHIQIVDGGAVVGPAGHGAEEKKLLERKFALKDVALGEAELALEVERRENLAADDNFFDVGGVLGDGVDDGVAEGFALLVPCAFGEFVGCVLDKAREDVLAGRRDAGIGEAGDNDIDVGLARKIAVLRVVVGALHVLDAGRNGNSAAEVSARAGQALEIGKRIKSKIYLARGTAE